MTENTDLRAFTDEATRRMGLSDELEASVEPEADHAEATEVDDATAEAFWQAAAASLSPAELARAESDEDFRDEIFAAWAKADTGANDEPAEDDAEDSAAGYSTGAEMLAAVLGGQIEVTDSDGSPVSPEEWAVWATRAPVREWAEACRAVGLDPRIRPSVADTRAFGHAVASRIQAVDWDRHLAGLRARDRLLGD